MEAALCVCVCFDLWLLGAVFQYSELPQLWLLPHDDIIGPYPWRLWPYFLELAFSRVPTKPDIVGPITPQHGQVCRLQPRYLASPGPHRCWETNLSVVVSTVSLSYQGSDVSVGCYTTVTE